MRLLASSLVVAVCAAAATSPSVLEQLLKGGSGGATPTVSHANLSSILAAYPETNVAVFYYSPYGDSGKYSRQVLPLWDEVAKWHREKKTKNLLIVKFSCESSVEAQQLCYDAGVRQYPTITFYGYGRLSFRRKATPHAPLDSNRATNYHGLALSDALRDWTVVMHTISSSQRLGDRVLQTFGWKPSPERLELDRLRERDAERDEELRRRIDALSATVDDVAKRSPKRSEAKSAESLRDAARSATAEAGPSASKKSATWDSLVAELARRSPTGEGEDELTDEDEDQAAAVAA